MHLSNTFDSIYQTETLKSLKLDYSSGQDLLPTVCSDEKLFQPVWDILVPTSRRLQNDIIFGVIILIFEDSGPSNGSNIDLSTLVVLVAYYISIQWEILVVFNWTIWQKIAKLKLANAC